MLSRSAGAVAALSLARATPALAEPVAGPPSLPGVTHHTAAVNDVVLHYARAGRGDPLILLHGWPQTWYQWRHVIPVLAERYTVVAPDLRGFADSSKPMSGYDTRTMAEDVHQLAQSLGFGRVLLAGHDVGAAVAYAYAAHARDAVRALAYIDEPLPGFSYQQYAAFSPERSRNGGFWWATFHMVPDLPEMLVQGRERLYLSWFYNALTYDKAAISPDALDEYVRAYSLPGAMRASRGFYRDVFVSSAQNMEAAATKLTIPVLALGAAPFGTRDTPLRDMRAVAEDVRGAVVEPCGHFIAEERPDWLAEQLLGFFGGVA
jgi:pimeloyl-ACP methyl ester carboxylesterase